MTKLGVGLAVLILSTSTAVLAQETGMTVRHTGDITWSDAPPVLPKGAKMAVLSGDPAKEGAFTMRVRLPANYKVAPHSHPSDEVVTVLSGDFRIGMGTTFDETKGENLSAGGFVAMPKGMQHYAWSTGGTEFQVNGQGPWGIVYVNPEDDPRKSQ
jgi:quercetin dioxygenase-like cupin family protein